MWDLIVSVPDHCLSFYFAANEELHQSHRVGMVRNKSNYVTMKIRRIVWELKIEIN